LDVLFRLALATFLITSLATLSASAAPTESTQKEKQSAADTETSGTAPVEAADVEEQFLPETRSRSRLRGVGGGAAPGRAAVIRNFEGIKRATPKSEDVFADFKRNRMTSVNAAVRAVPAGIAIQRAIDDVRAAARKKRPRSRATVRVRFSVGPDGLVQNLFVVSKDRRLEAIVAKELQQRAFPAALIGRHVNTRIGFAPVAKKKPVRRASR